MAEKNSNQLGEEKSPYLLKHSHHPIDWHPWDEEVFRDCQRRGIPIFLSIGYSSCHWCHVMEKESFSDAEVAEVFNRAFICIKVDSEELTHIDRTYMKFAEALMGSSGGWPLNLFLTPHLKPFYAVTYLPKRSSDGLMGLIELGQHIEKVWNSDEKDMLIEEAEALVDFFKDNSVYEGSELPDEDDVDDAIANFFDGADAIFGGLKGDLKFPLSYELETLMHYGKKKQEGRCEYFVRLTLDKMRNGGIYDQIAGGFSRYAVDTKWEIPHFEKMLFDNTLLASAYLEAYRAYGDEKYRKTGEEIVTFLLRDLYLEGNGFLTSVDSDQDDIEGKELTFSYDELAKLLTEEELEIAKKVFGVKSEGNFKGRNVLLLKEHQIDRKTIVDKLFAERMRRKKPPVDKKIITYLNAYAVSLLCKAAAILKNPLYLQTAIQVMENLQKKLVKGTEVYHRYCDGEVKFQGIFDDYAAIVAALLSLFEGKPDEAYLLAAEEFCSVIETKFAIENGAYSDVPAQSALLYTRCDLIDDRHPSPNSVHLQSLLKLWQITKKPGYLKRAEDLMKALKAREGEEISSMHAINSIMVFLEKKDSSC